MKKLKIVFFICLLALTSCFGLWDSGLDTITGDYTIMWVDTFENQAICKKIEGSQGSWEVLVPEYVYAVGHNDDYIIAKQHPTNGFDNGFKIDSSVTNYFIISIKEDPSYRVVGPLTEKRFKSLRKKVKINDIQFDQVYPDKP